MRQPTVAGMGAVAGAVLIGAIGIGAASSWNVGVDAGNHSSAQSGLAPAAPAGPTATCTSSSAQTIRVSWTSVPHATSYDVYA